MPAPFEQKGDIEDNHICAVLARSVQELLLIACHEGMDDPLEHFERRLVLRYQLREYVPVDTPFSNACRKDLCDLRNGASSFFVESMHGGIGIVDRNPQPAEHLCRLGLAHADRARQADSERTARFSHATFLRVLRAGPALPSA